jgi:hypothetical protein
MSSAPLTRGFRSCRDDDALNADELKIMLRKAFHLKAQLNGLAYATVKFVQRSCLGVASGKSRYRSDVVALFVLFDDDIKIALHAILSLYPRRPAMPIAIGLLYCRGRRSTGGIGGGSLSSAVLHELRDRHASVLKKGTSANNPEHAAGRGGGGQVFAGKIVNMKSEVLNALLTASTLFDAARRQCPVRDRHIASAGLVVLQGAVELVFYGCLLEMGVDESKAVESFTFYQLVGERKRLGLVVVKSGTLKAMNKQRVLIKHHAQLAEPAAAQQYFDASRLATDGLLMQVIGKPLRQVLLADAITKAELRTLVEEATTCIEQRRCMDSLIATRKVLFPAVETEYDIARWKDYDRHGLRPALCT